MSKQIRNTFLTGAMYAPFCRTLSAPMEEWDRDIQNMAEAGFTVVHGFSEWHDIEYEKGRFDFSRIDRLVECAVRHGIVPIVNVATQNSVGFYSPRWLIEEYRGRGEGFVDSTGFQENQSQFATPCLDDPIYQAYARRYLTQVAKHFAGDQRIGGYVLWGEPVLFRPGSQRRICYCKHTVAKFQAWLREKYGTVDALNRVWSSEGPADYIDFCQVLPPTDSFRQMGGFASWADWTEFMEQNLAGHIREADRLFKANGAMQPTIVEMLTGIHNGIDSWKLAETADIIGISCFGRPDRQTAMYMSMADSMAKALNKTTFVVEALGGSVKYFGSKRSPSANELKSTLLQRAGHGTKGLMYWCWRPRMSDTEGNDFGMSRSDGKVKSNTKEIGKTAAEITERFGDIYAGTVRKAEVAVFHSQAANHLSDSECMTEHMIPAVTGACYMMADLHIGADFICEKEILKGSLKKYKVLILPCAFILSQGAAAAIADYVRNGGVVIADYVLAEKKPGGFCYDTLPGGGLDEVFGIQREDILVLEDPAMLAENSYGICKDSLMDIVSAETAEIVKEYKDMPLVTCHSYGKGKACYITSQFFRAYADGLSAAQRMEILPMLRDAGVEASVLLEKADAETASALLTVTLYKEDLRTVSAVTITNSGFGTKEDVITVPAELTASLGGTILEVQPGVDGLAKVRFSLESWESMVLRRRD